MLFGYDVAWGLIKMAYIVGWFVGAGIVSLFILQIPSVKRFFKNI